MITPTIGRVVLYQRNGIHYPNGIDLLGDDQLMAAIVVWVHNDRLVNLAVFDHFGYPHIAQAVTLLQDDDKPIPGVYCEWMPYQKGQAAKADTTADIMTFVNGFTQGVDSRMAKLEAAHIVLQRQVLEYGKLVTEMAGQIKTLSRAHG